MSDAISITTPVAGIEEEEELFPEEEIEDEEGTEEIIEEEGDPDEDGGEEETEKEEEEDETDDADTEGDALDVEEVKKTVAALTAEGDACAQLLAKHDISYAELVAEYKETGELSKANIKALNDAGFPDTLIKSYIEGQQVRLENSYNARIFQAAGGKQAYESLLKWAAQNLSDEEATRFDRALDTSDIDIALTAVENLINRREKKQGVPPVIVKGRSAPETRGIRGFTSLEEMAAAQDDPRYEVDRAYTAQVERRMLTSDF